MKINEKFRSSKLRDHSLHCDHGKMTTEHFDAVLQEQIVAEEHNCRLIDNVFNYLTFKVTDFIGKFL
jgi:hypothetical protein